jgi:hypothetical protein
MFTTRPKVNPDRACSQLTDLGSRCAEMPGLGWHQNAGLPITHVRSDAAIKAKFLAAAGAVALAAIGVVRPAAGFNSDRCPTAGAMPSPC